MAPFSASILAGRNSLPAIRLTKMNPMPVAVNSSRYPTVAVMVFLARGCRGGHSRRRCGRGLGWLGRLLPDRLDLEFGSRYRRRVERRLSPGDVHGQLGKVHDAAVAAEATQVEVGAHEDAIDRTGIDAQ